LKGIVDVDCIGICCAKSLKHTEKEYLKSQHKKAEIKFSH